MAEFNVNDARAARLEKDGPHVVTIDDDEFAVDPEAPWAFVEQVVMGQMARALEVALGDEGWQALAAQSLEDVNAVYRFLLETWGLRNPESEDDEDAAGE